MACSNSLILSDSRFCSAVKPTPPSNSNNLLGGDQPAARGSQLRARALNYDARVRMCRHKPARVGGEKYQLYLKGNSLQFSTTENLATSAFVFVVTTSLDPVCTSVVVVSYTRSNEYCLAFGPPNPTSRGSGTITRLLTSVFWFAGKAARARPFTPMACANLGSASIKRRLRRDISFC